jgi:hypothetical protein
MSEVKTSPEEIIRKLRQAKMELENNKANQRRGITKSLKAQALNNERDSSKPRHRRKHSLAVFENLKHSVVWNMFPALIDMLFNFLLSEFYITFYNCLINLFMRDVFFFL